MCAVNLFKTAWKSVLYFKLTVARSFQHDGVIITKCILKDDGGFNILENLGHEFPLEYYQEADLPVNLYHDLPESSLYHDLSESNLYSDLPSLPESNMPLNPYSELNWRDLDTQVNPTILILLGFICCINVLGSLTGQYDWMQIFDWGAKASCFNLLNNTVLPIF